MILFPPTLILRHRRENVRKCSLRGLETRSDCHFWTYPKQALPDLSNYLLLSFEGPPLSPDDASQGIFLIDGTWRHAETMYRSLPQPHLFEHRSLPPVFQTAYPRRQEDCADPTRGLASVEALFIAYFLLGRETEGLLDGYYWKEGFLEKNKLLLGDGGFK